MVSIWLLTFTYIFTSGLLFTQTHGSTTTNHTRLNAWFKDCQEKTGASDSDFELIKMRKVPASEEGVCMVECLFTKLRIIDNGHQFNPRGFVITFSPIVRGDLKKLSSLKKIASICEDEIAEADEFRREGCDTTRMVLDCFARNKEILDIVSKTKKAAS